MTCSYSAPFTNAPRPGNASSFGDNTFTRTRTLIVFFSLHTLVLISKCLAGAEVRLIVQQQLNGIYGMVLKEQKKF